MSGRAAAVVLTHPAALRTPWHVALVIAALDVSRHALATLAVIAGGAAVTVVVLVLAVVSAPLVVGLLAWVLWRASRGGRREVKRSLARARRRARSLGLHVVRP